MKEQAEQLVNIQIPELREIAGLQHALHRQVTSLYFYYATADKSDWSAVTAQAQLFENRKQRLARQLGPSEFDHAKLMDAFRELNLAASAFHSEMSEGRRRSWDKLRDHLAQAQLHSNRIDN